ncbi:MAG: YfhO family protein [Oscillospiraceae bacterium]|nr:YfhO family protein [Oscillospiraceae bacterium]
MIKKSKISAWENIICIVILLFCAMFFFRNVLFSERLFGDNWDGKLTMLITEHWFHVFKGESPITELGMFYPAKGTLGFSDIFLGYGIIHSILRIFGMDVYQAYKYTLVVIHLFGVFSLYYLLKHSLNIDYLWALFGTIAYSFSGTFAIQIGHTQMFAIDYLPFIAILTIGFFQNLENRKIRNVYAFSSLTMLVLLVYTAWYIAFFSALFIVTVLVVWICVMAIHHNNIVAVFNHFIKELKYGIVAYLLYTVALLIPFVLLELPILRESGGRSYADVYMLMSEPIDFINVSTENWLLGGLIRKLRLEQRGYYNIEATQGFTLVLLGVFFFSLFNIDREQAKFPNDILKNKLLVYRTISISVVIGMLMSIKLSVQGASLWWFVYKFFPGAKSIRAASRYLLFLSVPMSIMAAVMGDALAVDNKAIKSNRKKYVLLMSGLILLLFLSNINVGGVYARWNRNEAIEIINNVSKPPEECKVFYMTNVKDDSYLDGYYQLKAYEISDRFLINTINGYSGLVPHGWEDIINIDNGNYEKAVDNLVNTYGLNDVYVYDETNDQWIIRNQRNEIAEDIDASTGFIPYDVEGIWDRGPKNGFTWTKDKVRVTFRKENTENCTLKLIVGTEYDKYKLQNPDVMPQLLIYVNEQLLASPPVINGVAEYNISVPQSDDNLYTVELITNCYFNPKELGENTDNRNLSLQLFFLGWQQ